MNICTHMSMKHCSAIMQMTVTWTSGYNVIEAVPFVEWGLKGESQTQSPAGTLTFKRNAMCGIIFVFLPLIVIGGKKKIPKNMRIELFILQVRRQEQLVGAILVSFTRVS
jgi:hypothetical protein